MQLINGLLDGLYNLPPIIVLLVGWALTPGGMFLAALIGESRILYLGRGQSRMFFPGDLGLGIVLMAVARSPQSTLRPGIAIVLAMLVLLTCRHFDGRRYRTRSNRSPTKIYHDLVGYLLMTFLISAKGLPYLWNAISTWSWDTNWLLVLLGGGVWLGGAAWDAMHPHWADFYRRHPDDWQPIWRTRRIKKYL